MDLGPYQKTQSALVTGLIGWGFVVVASKSGPITSSEWMGLAVAVATALGVYAVANVPPPGEPSDPNLSEQGMTAVELLVCVLVVILILILLGRV